MARVDYLKKFDKRQLFRFFVDGRFHRKYNGWVKYEERENGSVKAMMEGFAYMMDNMHRQEQGLNAMYLLELHRVCMLHVQTDNPKSSPGDIRYIRNGMPFFKKTTTLEHIQEVLEMRMHDGTLVFFDKEIQKFADDLDAKEVFALLQKKDKLTYRPWYPNLDLKTHSALEGKEGLSAFYDAKHYVQKLTVEKLEEIVQRYNKNIKNASNDDEKLRCIALIVRELELLHPFSDGNCRTFAGVLLNQLLIYHDFYPTMTYNPNLDGEYSLAQWTDEIKFGMQQTKILLDDPQARVYDFSIDDMSQKDQNAFLKLAANFIKKIEAYEEVYITPKKIVECTQGKWYNYEENLRFTGVGGSFGNLAFFTGMEDIVKKGGSVTKELQRIIKNGVRAIVIDDVEYVDYFKIPMFVVDDIFKAYEDVASQVRQEVNPTTVLITGTEGKTGTKIQLHHLFHKQVQAHAILNSANAKVPVLRTMANLKTEHSHEIVEFSVDANEEKTIKGAKLVNPDICFFTNIGREHMHNHKDISGVIKAKSSVVAGIRKNGKCIVNSSLDVYDDFVMALKNRRDDISIITYGESSSDNAFLISKEFNTQSLHWEIEANIEGQIVQYQLPLIQNHAPLMSVGILLAVKLAGLSLEKALEDYKNIKPFESMGLIHKIKKQDGQVLFYDQSRRASIAGVRSAFKDLQNFKIKGKVIALIGSISSVNENEWTQSYHEELAQLINQGCIDKLYTTGSNMQFTHDNLENKGLLVLHSDDYDKLYEYIHSELQPGDLLFVMGYMRLYLDRISKRILQNRVESSFDHTIYEQNLPQKDITAYKELMAIYELNHKKEPYAIANHCRLSQENIEGIKALKLSYTQKREQLLTNFFDTVSAYMVSRLGFESLNEIFKTGPNASMVYNEEFCFKWFNNIDKISSRPKKQLFGSFFRIDTQFMCFIIVGTYNIHFGIGKYKENEIVTLDEQNHKEIQQKFGTYMDKQSSFDARSWGKKWVTIDGGAFIDTKKATTFASMVDFEHSSLYKKAFTPLIKSIKDYYASK